MAWRIDLTQGMDGPIYRVFDGQTLVATTKDEEMAKKIAAIPLAHKLIEDMHDVLSSFPTSIGDFIPRFYTRKALALGKETDPDEEE